MAKFAHGTKTSVANSKAEIERTIKRYGAEDFLAGEWDGLAGVMFASHGRRVRFRVRLPENDEREARRLWRCLLLSIKSRLEIVASEIESFDEAFLAHIIMPDGQTVADLTVPRIEQAHRDGSNVPLLEFFRKGPQ